MSGETSHPHCRTRIPHSGARGSLSISGMPKAPATNVTSATMARRTDDTRTEVIRDAASRRMAPSCGWKDKFHSPKEHIESDGRPSPPCREGTWAGTTTRRSGTARKQGNLKDKKGRKHKSKIDQTLFCARHYWITYFIITLYQNRQNTYNQTVNTLYS